MKLLKSLLSLLLLSTVLHSQSGFLLKNPEKFEFVSDANVTNKLSFGLGLTSEPMFVGSLAFKLGTVANFHFGIAAELFGAEVNAGAHKMPMLLLNVVPEYSFYPAKKLSLNVFSGLGFIVNMEPTFCITPGVGFEYRLSSLISLEVDSKYLYTKQKNGEELDGIIISKLNLNFIF
jgi:hypothetical protein